MLIPKVLTNDIVMHGGGYEFCASYRLAIPGRDTSDLLFRTDDRRSFPIDGINVVVIDVKPGKQDFVLVFGKGSLQIKDEYVWCAKVVCVLGLP
jgi:hypothetical protein